MISTDTVEVREVGPREGIQVDDSNLSTTQKIALVDELSLTRLNTIQVTSLVNSKAVPQHVDAEEVMAGIARRPGLRFAVLVPNARGAERAVTVGADEWTIMLSASESHAKANSNASFTDALARAQGSSDNPSPPRLSATRRPRLVQRR